MITACLVVIIAALFIALLAVAAVNKRNRVEAEFWRTVACGFADPTSTP